MYYLRSKPSVNPVKFTVKKKLVEKVEEANDGTESIQSEESLGFNSSNILNEEKKPISLSPVSNKENFKELPVISARTILGLKQDTVQAQQDEEEEDGGCVMCSS